MNLKLGKRPRKFNSKTLFLSKYLTNDVLPSPPEKRAYEYSVPPGTWGMLANDSVGDCVIAAMLHYIQAARSNNGEKVIFTESQALELYSAITGYKSGDPSTDNGTAWTDALEYWQTTGCFGHKILGWAAIGLSLESLRRGINLFGGVLIGTAVTESMMQQAQTGRPWNSPFEGEVLGGHGIPLVGYGREGQTCVSWGDLLQMDPAAPNEFDEAYCVITEDWMNAQGSSPSGLNIDELTKDLQLLRR